MCVYGASYSLHAQESLGHSPGSLHSAVDPTPPCRAEVIWGPATGLGSSCCACKTLTFLLGVTKKEDLPRLEISQMAFP